MYVYTYIFPSSSIQYIWNILILEDLNSHPDWLASRVPVWLHQLFNYEAEWDGGSPSPHSPHSTLKVTADERRWAAVAAGCRQ